MQTENELVDRAENFIRARMKRTGETAKACADYFNARVLPESRIAIAGALARVEGKHEHS